MFDLKRFIRIHYGSIVIEHGIEKKLQHIADTLKIHCGTECGILIRFKKKWRTEKKSRSGRLRLFDRRDERSLVMKTPLNDLKKRFNQHGCKQVSKKTTHQYLFRQGYHKRLVNSENSGSELNWCRG